MVQEAEIDFELPNDSQKRTAIINQGALDVPYGLILAHGAGGNSRSGNLPQIAEAFAKAGFWCLRFDYAPPNLKGRVKCCEVGF
jgi:predicted alpha/beta-hydrolase family hydrolase